MTPRHQRPWAEILNGANDWDFHDLTLDVEPDDRVGAPLPSRFKSRLRKVLLGVILAMIAWAVASNPERAQGWLASAKSLFDAVLSDARDIAERANRERTALHPNVSNASAAPAAPLAPIQEATPTRDEKTSAGGGDALSTGSVGTDYAETPEPAAEAQDKSPKRVAAVAAGLSPDLPNVLLTRLSEADLKNAEYAIKTALAKTPDGSSFSWPPKPSREQALFDVRFVAGASQTCRRYTVTVTKDRWSSTSAAMEKCGDAVPHAG